MVLNSLSKDLSNEICLCMHQIRVQKYHLSTGLIIRHSIINMIHKIKTEKETDQDALNVVAMFSEGIRPSFEYSRKSKKDGQKESLS